jgi:large subunit ribosomal protein LP0
MSGADGTAARKQQYFGKLIKLLDEYQKILIVGIDNVGSNQLHKVRQELRGKAVVLMGKNTMIRKAIKGHIENNSSLEVLLPLIKGNVGFVFTKDDLSAIKKIVLANKISAPAKAGTIAPNDVIVPKGQTTLEPTHTAFFQALNIQTKINKGAIEIINDVPLIKTGQKVGNSEAALLLKLDIKPFQYGLIIKSVYDNGNLYDVGVLDMTDDDIIGKFKKGIKNVACVSLAIGVPSVASLPHSLVRGYKNVLAVALATDFPIRQTEALKKAAASAPAPTTAAPATKTEAKKEEPKKEEKKVSEEDEDMGLSLFD